MVAGGPVKPGKVIGHQVHLIHQGGKARAVHGVDQALVGPQGHGEDVVLARGSLAGIQLHPEKLHQG